MTPEHPSVTPTERTEAVDNTEGYEVWKAMIEDAVDRGEVRYLHPMTVLGRTIPATYWNPADGPSPNAGLYAAAALLSSACDCRGRLHPACVWPTIQRGEQPDMPEDWRDWTAASRG